MKKASILSGLIAVCAACTFLAASCSQSAQIGMTEGRAKANMAALVGLISLVIGGLALARAAGRLGAGNGRIGAIVALVVGMIGVVLSVVHLATFTGGVGTGSGRAGAIVALVLGLSGTSVGGLALARSRRSRT
jgi:hypothetical protein